MVDDAAGCFRQLAGGSLSVLKRGQNAVAGLGVNDAREVIGHGFPVLGFCFFHAREVDATTAQTCPVAQQIRQFIGLAFTVLAQAGHGELYPDVQRRQLGVQPLHFGTVGRGVAAPRKRGASGAEQVADCGVGGDHEGLDHPRGLVGPLHLHTQFVFAVKARAQFRVVEVQADFTALPNGGERQHVIVGVRLKHVPVGDVGLDVNDRFVSVGVYDVVLVVKVHADDHRQAVDIGS